MSAPRSALRNVLEFIPAWVLLKGLGILPRRRAVALSQTIARMAYRLHRRLQYVGHRNLEMALPELNASQRSEILRDVVDNLGRLLGEFSHFPRLDRRHVADVVVYEGFDNYRAAAERGNGVLLLTGHFGAWELCAFAHGVYGHPISFLVRPLDNPYLDRLIRRYRELPGNRTIDKNRAVRPVLDTLKRGEDVGLLIDVNVLPDQGTFCDFFGIPACSTTGLATFALRTGAPVVPGFLVWDPVARVHRLTFLPEVALIRTGDFREEVQLNTERYTQVIEEQVRRHPGQWLWIHRRWRTRPEDEPDLYTGRPIHPRHTAEPVAAPLPDNSH